MFTGAGGYAAGEVDHQTFNLLPFSRLVAKALEPAARFAYQLLMAEPSLRSSRLTLAAGLAFLIIVGGVGFLLGRGTTQRAPVPISVPVAAPDATTKSTPERPAVTGVLGRSDLIELSAAAADASAAGRQPDFDIAALDGRRFELRLPFGCAGPTAADSDGPMGWRYDEEEEVLRINVDSMEWSPAEWLSGGAAKGVEVVRGFWMNRPWTSSEECPVGGGLMSSAGTVPVMLPGQTLAIGQILFGEEGSAGRRDSPPYDVVVRVAKDKLSASEGFRLRLNGRLARTRAGGPVHCRQPAGPEQRPVCLFSVVMDEVAIVNPVTGDTLGTWNPPVK